MSRNSGFVIVKTPIPGFDGLTYGDINQDGGLLKGTGPGSLVRSTGKDKKDKLGTNGNSDVNHVI